MVMQQHGLPSPYHHPAQVNHDLECNINVSKINYIMSSNPRVHIYSTFIKHKC